MSISFIKIGQVTSSIVVVASSLYCDAATETTDGHFDIESLDMAFKELEKLQTEVENPEFKDAVNKVQAAVLVFEQDVESRDKRDAIVTAVNVIRDMFNLPTL